MDSSNKFSLILLVLLASPSLSFVVKTTTYSAAKDISNKSSSVAQVTNTIHVPALASPFVTPNNSVGSIYEKLPTAWATLSEEKQEKAVAWIEVIDVENTEHLLKHGEVLMLAKLFLGKFTSKSQDNEQANYFSIFMENNEMTFKNLMREEIIGKYNY
ncbi:hypothetical protein BDF19DRAFT_410280 [Syncephalis fuscata]|nr:hypothetical protein BDF19DRAFT_410280 [Syncephalis fuscata]